MSVSGKRIVHLLLGIILLAVVAVPVVFPSPLAFASQITSRALTISSSNPAASNATTTYAFTFTVPSTTVIKSVGIEICTSADGTCTTPSGFSNSSATLSSQPTGLGAASGWTVNDSTAGTLEILDASNSTAPSNSGSSITFGNVQNPTTANESFYGRITTYSDSAWTTAIDTGNVAASTATQIVLTGTMPESLVFCTGGTISTTGGVPDCTTATSGSITFAQLFSPTSTAWATSQMAASTNAGTGYSITVDGPTLTNGGTTIAAIGASDAASIIGTGQFGLNLVADTTPNITTSANVTPSANGTNLKGQPNSNFDTTNEYAFTAGSNNTVAASNDSGAGPSDAQIYTVSYIVNVPGSQEAGTYTTTLTYICTPTF